MQKSLNSKGFGLVAVLVVIAVLVVLGGAGAYVYHRDHKTKSTTTTNNSNGKPSTQTGKGGSTTPPVIDPYAGWQTYTDTTYHYSFKYPSDWTLTTTATTKIGDVGGASLLNPAKTVQVTYSNAYTQDSGAIAFTPSYISKLTSADEDLTIVGGYSPAGGLVGNYLPSYRAVDSSVLSSYPLTTGQQAQFPSNPRFTDSNTSSSTYDGALISRPAVSINTVSDAQTWLNSTDAKTSLLILESLTYQQ